MSKFEAELKKRKRFRNWDISGKMCYSSIILVVVGRGEELLKSQVVRAWVNHVLRVHKNVLEMKIY